MVYKVTEWAFFWESVERKLTKIVAYIISSRKRTLSRNTRMLFKMTLKPHIQADTPALFIIRMSYNRKSKAMLTKVVFYFETIMATEQRNILLKCRFLFNEYFN
jgi:hypothetical protein